MPVALVSAGLLLGEGFCRIVPYGAARRLKWPAIIFPLPPKHFIDRLKKASGAFAPEAFFLHNNHNNINTVSRTLISLQQPPRHRQRSLRPSGCCPYDIDKILFFPALLSFTQLPLFFWRNQRLSYWGSLIFSLSFFLFSHLYFYTVGRMLARQPQLSVPFHSFLLSVWNTLVW